MGSELRKGRPGLESGPEAWVAIKTCTFEVSGLGERFVHEAELAASLQNPNIVTVHDFGRTRRRSGWTG